MYVCSGKECREGTHSEDARGNRHGGSKSGDGGGREADAEPNTFAESDAEWKSDADAFTNSIAESFTRGADAKPDSESESESESTNVKKFHAKARRTSLRPQRGSEIFFAVSCFHFAPLRETFSLQL